MDARERLHWAEWDYDRAVDEGTAFIMGSPPSWYEGLIAVPGDDGFGSVSLAAEDNEEIVQKWADAALKVLKAAERDVGRR